MRVLQLFGRSDDASFNQRWGHYFTVGFAVVALGIGLLLRANTLSATATFVNNEIGIRAEYPLGWLIDSANPDYVFRVQDTSRVGYKTTMQVAIYPFSAEMTVNNVLTDISLRRQSTLALYDDLSTDSAFQLPSGEQVTMREYTFVETDVNPFVESLSYVVLGRDIVVVRREQAFLITFRAERSTYAADLPIFNQFLRSLDF